MPTPPVPAPPVPTLHFHYNTSDRKSFQYSSNIPTPTVYTSTKGVRSSETFILTNVSNLSLSVTQPNGQWCQHPNGDCGPRPVCLSAALIHMPSSHPRQNSIPQISYRFVFPSFCPPPTDFLSILFVILSLLCSTLNPFILSNSPQLDSTLVHSCCAQMMQSVL